MKIYLDLIFFLNFFFDTLLLLVTNIILKRNIKLKRIILGGLIGALSIFLLFIRLNSITLFLLKLIISVLMIIVTFGIKDKKYFIKNFIYLYFISIILGGFLYFLNIQFSYKNKGLIFIHNGLSINIIVLIILSPIILYFYIKQNKSLKIINNYYYKVEFIYNNKKYTYNGYLDTGNCLHDPYSNNPVIILYDKNFKIEKPIYIPCNTINNSSLLEGFKLTKIKIDDKEINKKVIVALSKNKLKMDGINVLLNNDFIV